MQKMTLLKNTITACLLGLVLTSAGCKKNGRDSAPGTDTASTPSAQNPHLMNDARLVGEWKNVSVSDINWQTVYGVNAGPQNGSYTDYKIAGDGSGSCIKYVTTTEGAITYSIFQRSSGFFKANKNGGPEGYYELTYCPTSGIVEFIKNGVSSKKNMAGIELYQQGDPHSARDFFPAYNIVTISSGSYTDPHHYIYCTYTNKDGNLVTTSNGNAKVTSFVDVL